jgi:hypothetical protein
MFPACLFGFVRSRLRKIWEKRRHIVVNIAMEEEKVRKVAFLANYPREAQIDQDRSPFQLLPHHLEPGTLASLTGTPSS